jgi:hypothetical protein
MVPQRVHDAVSIPTKVVLLQISGDHHHRARKPDSPLEVNLDTRMMRPDDRQTTGTMMELWRTQTTNHLQTNAPEGLLHATEKQMQNRASIRL